MKEIKVIQIPNSYVLLINYGREDFEALGKIKLGDKVSVYDKGIEVIDPETGESLGYYGETKEFLEVTNIFAKFSEVSKITRASESPLSSILQKSLSPLLSVTNTETKSNINIHETQSKNYVNTDKDISLGDLVNFID